jgi:hypothetical protein
MGVLIRSYGQLWSPDLVNWGKPGHGNKGQLLGEFGPQREPVEVDVWEQQGVYVLSHEWEVIYVGKSDKVTLGSRLRQHLNDELAGRWDRFSWYGIRGVVKAGELGAEVTTKNTTSKDLIATFESLLIAVTEPPKNRRRESLPSAQLVLQSGAERPRATASYLQEMRSGIAELGSRLERVEKHLDGGSEVSTSPPRLKQ